MGSEPECSRAMCKNRRCNEDERLFSGMKGEWRIFSRLEKIDSIFTGFINFAWIADGLRR